MALDSAGQAILRSALNQRANAQSAITAQQIVASGRKARIAALQAQRAAVAQQYAGPVPPGQQLQQWQPNFQQVTPGAGQQVPLDAQFGGRGTAVSPYGVQPGTPSGLAPYAQPSSAVAAVDQPGYIGQIRMANPGITNPNATAAELLNVPRAAAGDVAAGAGELANSQSILGQMGAGAEAAAPAATAESAGLLASLGGRAALMRGGMYAGLGYGAGQIENKLVGEHPGTSWDEAGQGALTGAGIGAGIGALGGPLDFLSVPVGAALGAVGGGLVGLFGPKSTGPKQVAGELSRQTDKVTHMADQLGLSAQDKTNVLGQLQAYAATVNSKGDVAKAANALITSLPGLAQQQQQARQADARSLAVQSMLSGFMAPYLNQANASSAESQSLTNQLAGSIGGQQGQQMRARAASQRSGADALTAAYASQVAMAPKTEGMDFAENVRKQAMAQIAAQMAAKTASGLGYGSQQNALAQLTGP